MNYASLGDGSSRGQLPKAYVQDLRWDADAADIEEGTAALAAGDWPGV
jgi:hypothetical protein